MRTQARSTGRRAQARRAITSSPSLCRTARPSCSSGTVSDTNLDSWVLELAPLGSEAFTPVASGTTTVAGDTLAHFDPAAVRNGVYRLRLTATDLSGRSSKTEIVFEADTATSP